MRHFEEATRQPENFIALGDSVCAFNPVYGQGMTIAAMGAMALDECLHEQKGARETFAKRFQQRLAKVNAAPWMLATSEDYRYRETEGGSPSLATRFMHRYMNHVLRLSTFDASVRRVLLEVIEYAGSALRSFQTKDCAASARQHAGFRPASQERG